MKELDICSVPLEGTTLIEASAGTGKTWSITGIFLRLLLEKRLRVEQILVVTFTNAATEELRMRVRKRLREARKALATGAIQGEDAVMQHIVFQFRRNRYAVQILTDALREFDRAAIFTIHGFCNRLLQEWAFETGSCFDMDLVTDPLSIVQEVCDDFWRIHFHPAPPEFINYCKDSWNDPKTLCSMLRNICHPEITLLPKIQKSPISGLDAFRRLLCQIKKAWQKSRNSVLMCLKDPALNRRIYTEKGIMELAECMDCLSESNAPGFPLVEGFERFTPKKLKEHTKKECKTPAHPFFDLCGAFQEAADALKTQMHDHLMALKTEFFRYAEAETAQRKYRLRVQFYEDLLLTVRNALRGVAGAPLIRSVTGRYQAALVDEFQDTDPVQYEIFSRLFSKPGQAFFMIGDPKQAIYGFRGADVFSYMKAAKHAQKRHTLTRNFRSTPGLVQSVNTLFSNVSHPFLFEGIPFHAGSAALKTETEQTFDRAALRIWFLSGKEGKAIGKTEAVAAVSEAVSAEIVSLVDSRAFQENEIAVLVRTHRQARIVKETLAHQGVPAVLFSDENVFDSHEAVELERLLLGILDPLNPFRVRAALATDIMGLTAAGLDSEKSENRVLEATLIRFREYHDLWHTRGFIPMFAGLMKREGVKARLIRYPDGERRLTNLAHLTELIQEASASHPFTMEGLMKWISERRDPDSPRPDAHQLRLESDENAVNIVTMHRSKGLEYSVVFCPFAWESAEAKEEALSFHDPDSGLGLVVDLDPKTNPKGIFLAQKERLAENIRLLYVAVTRAKKRCYLVWGRIHTAESSAMVYLFHHLPGADFSDPARLPSQILEDSFSKKSDAELLADLRAMEAKSGGCIAVSRLPEEKIIKQRPEKKTPLMLSHRQFTGSIPAGWKVSSYSSLITSAPERARWTDDDMTETIKAPVTLEPANLFSFPAGPYAGRFFHAFFEDLDFSRSPMQQTDLATAALSAFGFDTGWKEAVCVAASRILSTRLPAAGGDLILSALPPTDRIHEMEFNFPVKRVSPEILAASFGEKGKKGRAADFSGRMGKLFFSPWEGFMRGFMDLVAFQGGRYYLIDWKSNLLGNDWDAYSDSHLIRAVEEDYYFLQYHLYVLALYRYLKLKKPGFSYERDFGGVFYLFIRGISPDPETGVSGTGVYYDLPDINKIMALEKILIPQGRI
ncbi:MAG: exodeoxyribonuclease V subunit beta [Desulfobacterales bacterium CG07_land_8_20_14_0_80_52_14]|nr:MAG: exodeoxyribonuclease V subunit beta [Desulfobacterales bacterium CG23_combo_of_CG06-09_8_20_14_all_52_9]PIU48989.1 MAG: exodeoxyribonuclease V subunit beta [Desulfobacterales bacterium CG07_land_8_20_14_0_80_52_14]